MFVNLYTDSLKKGTYNYINVDGQLANGRFIPLDSTKVKFESNEGSFSGNALFLSLKSKADSVAITVTLREDPKQTQTFILYTKKIQTVFENGEGAQVEVPQKPKENAPSTKTKKKKTRKT
jgi:hypothetical protein